MFVSPHILVVQFLLGVCMRPHFTSRIWVVGVEDVVVVSHFITSNGALEFRYRGA